MHPTALEGFRRLLPATGAQGVNVLDVGGADVNGTVHEALSKRFSVVELDVLDIAAGPGVTMVGDASTSEFWRGLAESGVRYDLVISTETLEHVEDWGSILRGSSMVLRSGGWFVGTCASVGRRPHGARGAHDPAPGEWYGNVRPDELVTMLLASFSGEVVVEYSRRPGFPTTNDLYWRAQA
jgi:hypothetical protein